jgi:hypothetical protein
MPRVISQAFLTSAAAGLVTITVSALAAHRTTASSQMPALMTPTATATVHTAPGAKEIGRFVNGAQLTVLSRERGWVRVRGEGWVLEEQLADADSTMRLSPSAADIRADPEGMKGRLVRWDMEFISYQRADPLRRDLTADDWYILARGPVGENAIVYLVVPPALRSTAEAFSPLARITVSARVRVGRSQPVGVPILDLETLGRRR